MKTYSSLSLIMVIMLLLSACSLETTTPTQITPESTNQTNETENDAQTVTTTTLGSFTAHFIDVGQGDAIYLHSEAGDDILIDGGDRGKEDEVIGYLRSQGVTELDTILSTHPDSDHNGIPEVIRAYSGKVHAVYAPKVSHTTQAFEDFLSTVQQEGLKIQTAKAGVVIPTQDTNLKATFLAPTQEYGKSDLNNWSAVLLIEYGQNRFLFTGDAEFESEKDMLATQILPKVDVLKVSHHGAEEATSEELLQTIQPKYAVLSVGIKNRYDHPRQVTLDRLTNAHAQILRTDTQGSIRLRSDGTHLTVQTER